MCGFQGTNPKRIPVTMAKGSHLFPYRTQKLSLSAPMVLGWRRPGRVGRCRIPKRKHPTKVGCFLFVPDKRLLSRGVLVKYECTWLGSPANARERALQSSTSARMLRARYREEQSPSPTEGRTGQGKMNARERSLQSYTSARLMRTGHREEQSPPLQGFSMHVFVCRAEEISTK